MTGRRMPGAVCTALPLTAARAPRTPWSPA
ncbi:hypothetical protein Daqu01_01501 [Deinococcus aquaticus]